MTPPTHIPSLSEVHARNWSDISYLKIGTPRQRDMYQALQRHRTLDLLAAYDPVVVSTICLNIDTPASDIDILCYAQNSESFTDCLNLHFSAAENFQLRRRTDEAIICNFSIPGFAIEIFGCRTPIKQQRAYQHLLVSARLLAIHGEKLRSKLQKRKTSGQKTEPALAELLGLSGDPYQAVVNLHALSDSELMALPISL